MAVIDTYDEYLEYDKFFFDEIDKNIQEYIEEYDISNTVLGVIRNIVHNNLLT